VDLVLVQELVQRSKPRIIFLELLRHGVNVLDKLCQKLAHLLCYYHEFHDLGLAKLLLPFCEAAAHLVKFLVTFQDAARRDVFVGLHVLQLLIDVLLWVQEDTEFIGFEKVGAPCKVLEKLVQEITSLGDKVLLCAANYLLAGKWWDIETRKSFDEAASKSVEVLETTLNLKFFIFERTSAGDSVNDVVPLLQWIGDREGSGHVVGVERL
jgi:hypothetical protein